MDWFIISKQSTLSCLFKVGSCFFALNLFISGCTNSQVERVHSRNVLKQNSTSGSLSETNTLNQYSSNDVKDEKTLGDDKSAILLVASEDSSSNDSYAIGLTDLNSEEIKGNSLDYYIQIALSTNPEILAAQHKLAAQAQVIPQVTSLDDPTLADSFQPFDNYSVQTAAGRGPNTVSLSQKFPWFGKLDTKGRIAEADVQVAHTQLNQAKLKVIEDVNLAYYDVYYNQKAIHITVEDSKILKDFLRFADARYRSGSTSQQDVIRAQVELDKLDNRLILLERQFRQSQADLAEVTQADPESNLMAAEFQVPSAPKQIEQLYEAAITSRPEIQEKLHTIVRNQNVEELAHLQYKPDLTFGVGWQAITNDDAISPVSNSNDNVAFTVGINLPIWKDKLEAGVHEAEHRRAESTRKYEAVRDDTYRMIRRLSVQANSLEEQITLFRDKIVPKTERTLRISAADYRVGKVDFQQIIDNWSELLALQIQLVRMESDLGKTLARLERVVGREMVTFSSMEPGPAPAPVADPVLPLPAFEE